MATIQNLKQSGPDAISFNLVGVHNSLANALRRVMLAEIPNMAIDEVIFEQNNTPYTDEVIADRLRLIPIDPNTKPEQEFKLSAEGKSFTLIHIFSKEITPSGLIRPDVIIVPLRIGENIKLTARVKKGIPQEHAKYGMATTIGFKEEGKDAYYFLVESRYAAFNPPKEIVKKGIQTLIEKLSFVEKRINQQDNYKIEIQANLVSEITDIILQGETHTLGNLLSSYLYLKYYPKEIDYVSYNVPHPLEERAIIKVRAGGIEKAKKYLGEVISNLIKELSKLKV